MARVTSMETSDRGDSLHAVVATADALFQAGGTLRQDALYLRREADAELPAALLSKEICYVLAPRQIGKSSLRVRTEQVLRAHGVRCVTIDLTTIGGKNATLAEWYFGLIDETARQLALPDAVLFWREHELLSPVQRWGRYLRDVVLAEPGTFAIFIDETDAILSQSVISRDEFFAALRALYNLRANDSTYDRLTFCLFGVMTPTDLSQDEARTPFNIGRGIHLEDFTRSELAAMVPALRVLSPDPESLLDELFIWTYGHPYMTQKFGRYLTERGTILHDVREEIAQAADYLFLQRGRTLESALAHAEQCFARDSKLPRVAQMLRLYHQLLGGAQVPAQAHDPVQLGLRMTGLAAERSGPLGTILAVRNRVFATVFDIKWVNSKERERHSADLFSNWLQSGRRDDFLLRGEALRQAMAWAEGREDVTSDERAFLLAALDLARAEEVERERRARLKAEARINRRNIRILSVLLLVMISALGTALWQYRLAREARVRMERNTEIERGLLATQLADRPGEMCHALLIGMQAVAPSLLEGRDAPPEAVGGLAAAAAAATMVPSQVLKEHRGAIHAAAFAPDGRTLITGGQDGVALIWDVQTSQVIRRLNAHPGGVLTIAYSHSGHYIATGGRDTMGRIWDATTGRIVVELVGHTQRITHLSFSRDDRWLVSGSEDKTARIWDSHTGEQLRVLSGHREWITFADFSKDGQSVISTSFDSTIRVWNTNLGVQTVEIHERQDPLFNAAMSPDSNRIVVCRDDANAAEIWDLPSRSKVMPLKGHSASIYAAAFSHDGRMIITGSADSSARIWDAADGKLLMKLEGHDKGVAAVAFSPDGNQVLTAGWDGTARLWQIAKMRQYLKLAPGTPMSWAVYSPDGKSIATSFTDGDIGLWDAANGKPLRRWQADHGTTLCADFSNDSNRLAVAGTSSAAVWDVHNGAELIRLRGHTDRVFTARFSPDGRHIATASADRSARIWDAATGREERVLTGHQGRLYDVAWSPREEHIATASEDGTARIWDARSGSLLRTLSNHDGEVYSVQYSPNGLLLATAGTDTYARIFVVQDGKQLHKLAVSQSPVYNAAFTPDGDRLLTAGLDHNARVWDTQTGRLVFPISVHEKNVKSALPSPDGKWILTASADGTARILPAHPRTWYASACDLLEVQFGSQFNLALAEYPLVLQGCQRLRTSNATPASAYRASP